MKNKYHFAIIITALALFAGGFTQAQQSLAQVHKEGVALFNAGNYQDALAKFQKVLRAQPSYINARVYSSKCQQAMKNNYGPKKTVQGTLTKVVIPAVDFQEVPLGDALTYIRQRTQELTAGKVTPNFIYAGSVEQRNASTITMKLNQVPVTTLLKYIGTQTRCKIQYDEHAIMVTPYDNIPQTVASPKTPSSPFEQEAPNPFK